MRLAPRSRTGSVKGAESETLDVCAVVGKLSAAVAEAQADGRMSEVESARIVKTIDAVHKELGDLRLCVTKRERSGA